MFASLAYYSRSQSDLGNIDFRNFQMLGNMAQCINFVQTVKPGKGPKCLHQAFGGTDGSAHHWNCWGQLQLFSIIFSQHDSCNFSMTSLLYYNDCILVAVSNNLFILGIRIVCFAKLSEYLIVIAFSSNITYAHSLNFIYFFPIIFKVV